MSELSAHHKFSQSKVNRKLYKDLLEDPRNIQTLCLRCHIAEYEGIVKFNEREFCEALGIEPRGKAIKKPGD